MPSLDLSLLFNPAHWFDGNPGAPSPWYSLLVVLFTACAVAGAVFYYYQRPKKYAGHSLHNRLAEVVGMAATWYGIGGLFLVFVRYLGIGLISARVLLYLTLLAGLGMVGYAIYFWRKLYPARLAAYKRDQERKRFLPAAKGARPGTPQPGVPPANRKKTRKKR